MARRIALLGTGYMGLPMARNLLKAGFELAVWNRTRARAEPLAADGAQVCASAAEAVANAEVIITMLLDGAAVTEVLFGGGAVEAASPGALFIDMSSIQPSVAREHARALAERGLSYLDAPVSGGTVGAEAATLAIMAGGDRASFETAAPVFAALGRPTLVGPAGAGQLAKLANQAIVAITIGAVGEALLLAKAGGADPAAVREAIMGGFATSRILELHGKRMIERDFVPTGAASTQLKDLDNVLEAAREVGLDLPLTKAVREAFAELCRNPEWARADHNVLMLWLESKNVPHRLGEGPDRLG